MPHPSNIVIESQFVAAALDFISTPWLRDEDITQHQTRTIQRWGLIMSRRGGVICCLIRDARRELSHASRTERYRDPRKRWRRWRRWLWIVTQIRLTMKWRCGFIVTFVIRQVGEGEERCFECDVMQWENLWKMFKMESQCGSTSNPGTFASFIISSPMERETQQKFKNRRTWPTMLSFDRVSHIGYLSLPPFLPPWITN